MNERMNTTAQKTVLVADDNDGIVASLTMLLEYGGYKVISIMTGRDVEKIAAPFPDLILLDISMGDVSGVDVCKRLKTRHDTRGIPIVIISAHPDMESMIRGSGASGFIEKPYTMQAVLAMVAKQLPEPN